MRDWLRSHFKDTLPHRLLQGGQGLAYMLTGGKGVPPHVFKRRVIRQYARDITANVFVETGTYEGDMIQAMLGTFEKLYSVEAHAGLYEQCCERFRKLDRVHIASGDSVAFLTQSIDSFRGDRCVFWLDAHYSGQGTAEGIAPILDELKLILGSECFPNSVVLIDDARLFGTQDDYPTLDEVRDHVRSLQPTSGVEVDHDIIRVLPGVS